LNEFIKAMQELRAGQGATADESGQGGHRGSSIQRGGRSAGAYRAASAATCVVEPVD
jgi:hypothetical protein